MINYQQLQEQLQFNKALPVTPQWSAAADFLFIIKEHCLKAKPSVIVECSSGLTTLTLARCCQLNQQGHVYSLENGEEFKIQTDTHLQTFELEAYADVYHAPLIKMVMDDVGFDWYTADEIQNLKIDMLVIDGPPGFLQAHSRFPALPVLFDQLSDHAQVFLDDAARDDEKEIIRNWQKMYPNTKHKYIDTQRGCSVLTIDKRV